MYLEVMRFFIPQKMMIGDNKQAHWKAHMNKLQFISKKTNNIIEGFEKGPGDFSPPPIEEIHKITKNKFKMIFEIWIQKNVEFDLYNYSKTTKAVVDAMTNNGYWEDDNWKCISPSIISGGGYGAWEDAIRFEKDSLPDKNCTYAEFKEWWESHDFDKTQTLIRVIISDDRSI